MPPPRTMTPPQTIPRPPPPPPDQSIHLIREQLRNQGIEISQETLDRLETLDPRVLDAMQRGLWRVYGTDASQLTDAQRTALTGWLDNMIDRSGEIAAVLDSADWYNDNAWIAENAGTAVSIGKGGVMIAAVVFNPAALPVLIAIEGTATNVEHGATAVGEFTAAMQDGFTVDNAIVGTKNATIAVTVRLAGGRVANMVIPLDTVTNAAGREVIKLGDQVLNNATRAQLQRAAAAWIGQEVTKTGWGAGASRAGNLLSQPGKPPDVPMVSLSRPFDLPPGTPGEVPVKTVTRTFDLPPEMMTPKQGPAPSSLPTGTDDPIGRVIDQSLRGSGPPPPPPAVESGLFDNPPTLPAPRPAPAGSSEMPADVADLFVNKMPSSFPPTSDSGRIITPTATVR
ncbi:MAG: hypothetical protein HKP30_17705 [Myxococcales bacterium]|nr:hypothetical protein [Myxococcales bacterium]